jgi:penicillin amidase
LISTEEIKVYTVDYGIKFVEAETLGGAAYGMGYSHGVDRTWQLQFYRALAKGRLSEILGAEALTIDKHIRTIGLPYRTDEHMKILS